MQMRANRSRMEHLPCILACVCVCVDVSEAVYANYLKRARASVGSDVCVRAWTCVSVHGYCCLKRECACPLYYTERCERRLSVCLLLSVQSSRRQQGAPFQFTHQPRRQGVKARGIAVGDFTFEGRDYQSGDPLC